MILVIAFSLAFILPLAQAEANTSLNFAAPLITPPVIDGQDTTADEWEGASRLTGWADNILGVANSDKTFVNVGHHQNTLYVRMVYPIPEKFRRNSVFYSESPLKVDVSENDGDIFQDDYLGFYLSPPDSEDIYVFGVNGTGAKLDSKNEDVGWNGQWQASQKWDRDFWRVEFSLPLSAFTGPGEWGINFVHGARQVESMESIWAYRPAQTRPLAEMHLLPEKISIGLLDFGDLNEGTLAFRGWIENRGADQLTVESVVEVADAESDRKVIFGPPKEVYTLKPGEQTDLAVSFDVPGSVYGDVTVTIKDAKGAALLIHTLRFVFSREIRMEARYIPTPELLQVIFDLGSPDTAKKVSECTIKIISKDTGKVVLSQAISVSTQMSTRIPIDCRQVPVGEYEVVAEVKIGPDIVRLKNDMSKEPQPEWLNNTVGFSDQVPPPWTDLEVTGKTVFCWGRDYSFGAGGFPRQIGILGKDILARASTVSVKVDGKSYLLDANTFRVNEKKETKVAFKTVAAAGAVSVTADTWIEFDGFVWNTITFASDKPASVESLSVEIPLKKEYATLWWAQWWGGKNVFNNLVFDPDMATPPKTRSKSAPTNFLRLGDEERGIQFYYESFHGWDVSQTLIPGKTDYVLRYDFTAHPSRTGMPRPIALGYMALPCRPRSPTFRQIDGTGWVRSQELSRAELEKTSQLFQVRLYTEGWNIHWNYFNFWNEDVFDKDFLEKYRNKLRKEWKESKQTSALYINAANLDANTPEFRKYRFEWQPVPGRATYVPPDPKTRNKRVLIEGCPNAKSAIDFLMWHMDKTVKYLSMDGTIPVHTYIDTYGHYNKKCSNTLHGCPPEGHTPVLATRELLKRVYIIYKSINPLNQVFLHTGGENSLSAASFTDAMIDGEQFRAPYYALRVNDPSLPKNYTRILNLARARAQMQSYAWGPERYQLYQFWRWSEKEPDGARGTRAHLWGLIFSHDVPGWSAGTPTNIVRATRELGWDDKTAFIPYWREKTGIAVTAAADPVVASAWRRGDGNLLLMVFNDSDKADVCRLTIDFAKYGFKRGPIKCRDYGAAGLGYKDSVFIPQGGRMRSKEEDVFYLAPDKLEVKGYTLKNRNDIPLEINEHSYRLVRFFQ